MGNSVQPAMSKTSATICNSNPRIKYKAQYKDGKAYFSLNNIHDEDTTLYQQSQARNDGLNSEPNRPPTSLISETTKQAAGRTDLPGEAATTSLGTIAYHNQDTQSWKEPWKEQPVIGYPQQSAPDTMMTDLPLLSDGTPEAPEKSDQSGQRKRGRPPGSKNKPKPDPSAPPAEKRRRGRPLGAKNKPKVRGAPPAKATGGHPTPSVPPENTSLQNHDSPSVVSIPPTYVQDAGPDHTGNLLQWLGAKGDEIIDING